MGILGIGACKWVGTGSPDSNAYTFTKGVLKANYSEPINILLESVINGKRTLVERGVHGSFEIEYHLHKEANPSSSGLTVLSYLHKNVKFYPHVDGATAGDGLGKCLKNSAGSDITCRVASIEVVRVSTFLDKEDMIIKLYTNEPFDITKSMQ